MKGRDDFPATFRKEGVWDVDVRQVCGAVFLMPQADEILAEQQRETLDADLGEVFHIESFDWFLIGCGYQTQVYNWDYPSTQILNMFAYPTPTRRVL